MQLIQLASKIVQTEEAWRPRPYYCSEGYPTVGWGFKVGLHGAPLPDMFMTREEGDVKLRELIEGIHKRFCTDLRTADIYPPLSDVRKATLISMAYQLGWDGLLGDGKKIKGFPAMWRAIRAGNWHTAAAEALDSVVAREQTPARWKRNASMLDTDALNTYYGFIG